MARGAILYAGVGGTSRAVSDTQPKYIQPRLGFAYQIHPYTVIRGGVGRFTQGTYIANHANQQGYTSQTTFNPTADNFVTYADTLANPYPGGLVPQTGNSQGVYTNPGSITSFYTADVKRQYTDDVSLHWEQQYKDFLFEIGGVLERTVGMSTSRHVNDPSTEAWRAAYGPKFDATGRPVDTLPGDTPVSNPFKGAPYITTSLETSNTVTAFAMLRPNPLVGDLTESLYDGKTTHYALQSKVQRCMRNGFAVTGTFSWGKQMDATGYLTSHYVSQKYHRQLSSNDRRFQFVVAPSYTLPFGRGKLLGKNSKRLVDGLIGGWEISALYSFYFGTPLSLPTNSAFFQGGDPGLGKRRTNKQWFDTSKFVAFPSRSITTTQLWDKSNYPDWTGVATLPGYSWSPTSSSDATKNGVYQDFSTWSTDNPTYFGSVRNPILNTLDLGFCKPVKLKESVDLQLRLDAFNALNHPRFGNINVTAGSTYFGYLNGSNTLSQNNFPRQAQLEGRIRF